jgi:hypothetical protein
LVRKRAIISTIIMILDKIGCHGNIPIYSSSRHLEKVTRPLHRSEAGVELTIIDTCE